MKVLNAYAGIGGNRKLWGDDDEIVAIEYDEKIAAIYADLWPNDTVIVTDAHQYILEHYQEFDLSGYSHPDKAKLLNNCVAPEIGLAIFQAAKGIYQANRMTTGSLF